MTDACTVYVTAASEAEALKIARAVVAERLAACGNIYPIITSVYHWDDKVNEGSEAALLLKTRRALYDRLEARIRELHSYDVPCIVVWPIEDGSRDFLNWIDAETNAPGATA